MYPNLAHKKTTTTKKQQQQTKNTQKASLLSRISNSSFYFLTFRAIQSVLYSNMLLHCDTVKETHPGCTETVYNQMYNRVSSAHTYTHSSCSCSFGGIVVTNNSSSGGYILILHPFTQNCTGFLPA